MEDNKSSLDLRIIHWLMAVFIIVVLCSGFYMKSLPVSNEFKCSMYTIHKACGVTIFKLVVVRVLFCAFTCISPLPASFSRFEVNISRIVHFGLYALIILVPLSGYVMSSASGRETKYFFHVHLLISKNEGLANAANGLHSVLVYFMVFFVVLHILAALKHTLIDKQNIFRRVI